MSTNNIKFNEKTYAVSVILAKGNAIALEEMSAPDLAKVHNLAAEILEVKGVKRFSDHKSAVRRTWIMLEAYDAWAKAEKEGPTPAPKAKAKAKSNRKMHFVFAPASDGVKKIRDEKSLRGQIIKLLTKGGTFEQIVKVVEKFDADRGKKPVNVRTRAYEGTRILHYYLGYGMKQDDKGVITLYTK
ncbi:MAG: hypothetical protein JRC86_01960 [Deltaproteobacteria bacterium]|nr:hypothetical protein [Deltaproteobacteria bacterium]